MVSGDVRFGLEIDEETIRDLPSNAFELHSGRDGWMAHSTTEDWGTLYIYENNDIMYRWYSCDYIDLQEVWFTLEQISRHLPFSLGKPTRVKFDVKSDIQIVYDNPQPNEDGIVEFEVGRFDVAATTTDRPNVISISSVRGDLPDRDSLRDTYYEAADALGKEFQFVRVL